MRQALVARADWQVDEAEVAALVALMLAKRRDLAGLERVDVAEGGRRCGSMRGCRPRRKERRVASEPLDLSALELAGLVALLLVACAGGRAAGGPANGAPAALAAADPGRRTASGSAPALRELTITEPSHNSGYLPLYTAQRRGFFAAEGLNVVSLTMGGGGPDVNAVLTQPGLGSD